jgi:hypothetical protein
MNASRLAVWIVGAAVSGAWLASAAGITRQARTVRSIPAPPEVVQFDALATEVQAQAGRLRERLATAPAPRAAERNPFSFSSRQAPKRRAAVDLNESSLRAPVESAPMPAEPRLELIGIALSEKPEGAVRTAMITGDSGELIMVVAGQTIVGRYDVVQVAEDSVELKDIETGVVRRLVLR